MKKTIRICSVIILVLLLSSCDKTSNVQISKLSVQDQEYYEQLSNFELTDKDKFEKYIRNYIEYSNKEVPEDILKELEELTDASMIDTLIKNNFLNTIEQITEEVEGDRGFIDESEVAEGEYDYIQEDMPSNKVINIFYIYSDNTYVAKVSAYTGRIYLMYFKVRDGKVVDIYV